MHIIFSQFEKSFNFQNLSLGGIFQFGGVMNESFSEFSDNYKLSAGLECRLQGFSFYSYPTAIAYEYHHPINDSNKTGKHYFTLTGDNETMTFNVKCKEIYITPEGGVGTYCLFAELTGIHPEEMYVLTGSGLTE